jgi:hypothetical protein
MSSDFPSNAVTIAVNNSDIGGLPQRKDPYFKYVTCLLHFNGADGGNTFVDSTGLNTFDASSAITSANASVFGGTSGYFSINNTDRLTVSSYNPLHNVSGVPFTVEFFILPTRFNGAVCRVLGMTSGSLGYSNTTGTHWGFFMDDVSFAASWGVGGTNQAIISSIELNKWSHVALTNDGRVMRLFIDGSLVGANESVITILSDPRLSLNYLFTDGNSGTLGLAGYLDEFRITKGICRYVTNFTIPNFPHPDS